MFSLSGAVPNRRSQKSVTGQHKKDKKVKIITKAMTAKVLVKLITAMWGSGEFSPATRYTNHYAKNSVGR